MKLHTEKDVSGEALADCTIAIIGYGSQGRAHIWQLVEVVVESTADDLSHCHALSLSDLVYTAPLLVCQIDLGSRGHTAQYTAFS